MGAPPPSLPSELLRVIFCKLSPNEIAVSARLVSQEFCSLMARDVDLLEPVPRHAFQQWLAFNSYSIDSTLNYEDRCRVFIAVCASGSLENLALLSMEKWPWSPECFLAAASSDHLPVLTWLMLEGCSTGTYVERQEVILAAAQHGSLATLCWAVTTLRCELVPKVLAAAAASEHAEWQEKIQWLLKNGCPWDKTAPDAAARHGRLPALRLLHSLCISSSPTCWPSRPSAATTSARPRTDDSELVSLWMETQVGGPLPPPPPSPPLPAAGAAAAAAAAAVQAGDGADDAGAADTDGVLDAHSILAAACSAAAERRLPALKWLFEECGLRLRTAGGGDGGGGGGLDVSMLLRAAARGGDVGVLSYIIEQCGGDGAAAAGLWAPPLSAGDLYGALLAAAREGRAAAVRYLVGRGARLSADVTYLVAFEGVRDDEQQQQQHGPPAPVLTADTTARAASGGGIIGGDGVGGVEGGGGGGGSGGGVGGGSGGGGGEDGQYSCAGMLRWLRLRGCLVDGRSIVCSLDRGDVAAAEEAFAAAPSPFRNEAMEAMEAMARLRQPTGRNAAARAGVGVAAAWRGDRRKGRHRGGGGGWGGASGGGRGGGGGGGVGAGDGGERVSPGLACMQWLHSHGCPLPAGARIMAEAARSGDLLKVQWLHAMRCDLDAGVFAAAASSGAPQLLTWLARVARCPMGQQGEAYLMAAASSAAKHERGPDWVTLRTLRELGCPWGAETFLRIAADSLLRPWTVELLLWLGSAGCPCPPQAIALIKRQSQRPDLAIRVRHAVQKAAAEAAETAAEAEAMAAVAAAVVAAAVVAQRQP